jgi:hypothetical protein
VDFAYAAPECATDGFLDFDKGASMFGGQNLLQEILK